MLMPLALLVAGLTHLRGCLVDAPQQYRELFTYMARNVLELRLKLFSSGRHGRPSARGRR